VTTSNGAEDEEAVEAARSVVLEAFERSAEVYGLNRSYGRLYGILYFADGPLSLDDIVEESGYAKSTVSNAMQQLSHLHMVHRRSVPGEGKKAFYEAERDFWRILQQFLKREVQQEIDTMTRALDEAERELADAEGERAERMRNRVQSLQQIYSRSQRLVTLLTSSPRGTLEGLVERFRDSGE
jgi:DNA-binding transcriptional regulator GbsR (MarR family)